MLRWTGESWDILFCDFSMPHFSGLRALEIVQERKLDLPFIFVSGTLGEDVAVAAMKVGAHDYVMKDNLARLIPSMERELRDAELRRQQRQVEEDMRISEYKYRQLFESLGDAAFLIDKETGRIIDSNPQAEMLLGRSRARIVGTRENQLFWPETERLAAPAVLSAGDGQHRFESNVLQTSGRVIPVYISVSDLELYGRKLPWHSFTTSRPANARKRKSRSKPICWNWLTMPSLSSASMRRSSTGIKGPNGFMAGLPKRPGKGNFGTTAYEDRTSYESAKKVLLQTERWSGEARMRSKTQRDLTVASSWTLVRDERGEPSSILVIDTDVTEKKQMEVQFLRAQRLELIGTLASGIAHDLNNILQVIITNLDLANSAKADDGICRSTLTMQAEGQSGQPI